MSKQYKSKDLSDVIGQTLFKWRQRAKLSRKKLALIILILLCLLPLDLIAQIPMVSVSKSHAQAVQAVSPLTKHKRILILRSYGYGREGPERYNRYFVSTLISGGISAADIMVEYLDLNRNQDKEFHKKKREILLHQYGQKKFDLIVAVNSRH